MSHFYLAKFWAEALTAQDEDAELKAKFAPLAKALAENEDKIIAELAQVQGQAADIGGHYAVDTAKVNEKERSDLSQNEIGKFTGEVKKADAYASAFFIVRYGFVAQRFKR